MSTRFLQAPLPATSRDPDSTRWLVLDAADGCDSARARFAERFLPVARRQLEARWRGTPFRGEVDDAVQEVFFEFLRPKGALARVDERRTGNVRAFFAVVVKHVALRVETRRGRRSREHAVAEFGSGLYPDERDAPSRLVERDWAATILRETLGEFEAAAAHGDKRRRAVLLRLRYQDGRCLRDVAREWALPEETVYAELRQARQDFAVALKRVVARSERVSGSALAERCRELIGALA